MERRLFCEINGLTYVISQMKERALRHFNNWRTYHDFCSEKSSVSLRYSVYKHKSLIMRKLGNSDLELQENKKRNLELAAPKLNGIIIKPGETFSFWKLVGKCTEKKGFKHGVTISNGEIKPGVAGGMCQMTNLIHWMILHSPLEIIEHHHHHRFDIFPDFNRQIPFGTGTSIMYNYLDYRFKNNTEQTFQLNICVGEKYLEGDLRADDVIEHSYHVVEKNHHFRKENNKYYRCNEVYTRKFSKRTGNLLEEKKLLSNKSEVLYDPVFIQQTKECEEVVVDYKIQ